MQVLIVSKTRTRDAYCIGGLNLVNNQCIRLLGPGGTFQARDTPFQIGNVWNIDFEPRNDIQPPHIEDVIVTGSQLLLPNYDIPTYLLRFQLVNWHGPINNVFNNMLQWTENGAGYIPIAGPLPPQSVGFWIPQGALTRSQYNDKFSYNFLDYPIPNNLPLLTNLLNNNIPTNHRMTYVGTQDPPETIPAETILRLSLSRAFPPIGSTIDRPRGYYLQLSGWY